MDGQWIASTSNQGLRPVGPPGQRDHGLLVQILRQHLSENHAALFAEPVPVPDGRSIDWYTSRDGPAQPLTALDPAAQEAVKGQLDKLRQEIGVLADRLAGDRDPDVQRQADVLKGALEIPGPGYVWVVGGAPVLVGWAHLEDRPDAPTAVLAGWARPKAMPRAVPPIAPAGRVEPPAPPAPPAAPPPPPAAEREPATVVATTAVVPVVVDRRWGWVEPLLWLILLMLVLALAWLMLAACGVTLPGGLRLPGLGLLDRCAVAADLGAESDRRALLAEQQRQRQLEEELGLLERELVARRQLCVLEEQGRIPPVLPPDGRSGEQRRSDAGPGGGPGPNGSPSLEQRLQREGAQTGEIAVSLSWDGPADLDLIVECPGGERVFWRRTAACGGTLDVDMNFRDRRSDAPVENVFWPNGAASPGRYRVAVEYPGRNNETRSEVPFTVRVKLRDQETTVPGTAQYRQTVAAHEFEVR